MNKNYSLNDKVIMKKPHACGTNLWTITRLGADIKITCDNCNRQVMLDRLDFNKRLKKVIKQDEK